MKDLTGRNVSGRHLRVVYNATFRKSLETYLSEESEYLDAGCFSKYFQGIATSFRILSDLFISHSFILQ